MSSSISSFIVLAKLFLSHLNSIFGWGFLDVRFFGHQNVVEFGDFCINLGLTASYITFSGACYF
jgi:hypothetical protein